MRQHSMIHTSHSADRSEHYNPNMQVTKPVVAQHDSNVLQHNMIHAWQASMCSQSYT